MYYVPRILAILIVLFFGMFAFEGFSSEFGIGDALMHLALTLPIILMTVVAWKKPRMGGWIFIMFGVLLLIFIHPLWWYGLLIGGVPLVTGALFLANKSK